MEPKHIRQARRELAHCAARTAAGHPYEIKGAELRRRRQLIEHERDRPLYLIACSATKLDHAAPARELYTGQAFRFAMAAAADGEVFILSALHGLVHPSQVIEPYNVTLSELPAAERAAWCARVAEQLEPYAGRRVIVLAGANYAAACAQLPRAEYPLAGLGIGQQLAALKAMGTEPTEPADTHHQYTGQMALTLD